MIASGSWKRWGQVATRIAAVLACIWAAQVAGAARGAAPAGTGKGPATQPAGAVEAAYVHKATGYAFPSRMGEWKFSSTHDYKNDGTDVSAAYHWDARKATMTMYIYPAPAGAVGPTFALDSKGRRLPDANADLKYRLAPAGYEYVRQVRTCAGHVLSQWKARIESVRMVQAAPEKNGPLGVLTRFRGEREGAEVLSELLIFASAAHYVKFRITYPAEEASAPSWAGEFPVAKFLDDQKETAERLRKAAEGGELEAMHAVAEAMLHGGGLPCDPNGGLDWCRKAAQRDHAPACRTLGLAYRDGLGVRADAAESAKWLAKAAQGGDVPSMHALGLAHAAGAGVSKDLAEAAQWFGKAAEGDWVPSLTRLGLMLLRGEGVEKDLDVARTCLGKAAALGDKEAAEALRQAPK